MKTAIWGAGQAGYMVKNMLPSDDELICFIDGSEVKQNSLFCGEPVLSVERAIALNIEKIWIAVLNKEAAGDIKRALTELNFRGEIVDISFFRQNQDLRLASVRLAAYQTAQRRIAGEVAELGVYKGDTAAELNALFPDRKIYLFDTFTGFDCRDLEYENDAQQGRVNKPFRQDFKDTSVEYVLSKLPHPQNAIVCKGYFPQSVRDVKLPENFAFVSIDPDLYAPVLSGLKIFYPKLSRGGVIHIHDYNSLQYPGVKRAVDEFCGENGLFVIPIADFHGSAVLLKI